MKLAARTYLVVILVFLYLPIAVLVAMGFNESPLYALPFRFTTHWYEALGGNAKLLRSSWNSIVIALVTSALATGLGTLRRQQQRAIDAVVHPKAGGGDARHDRAVALPDPVELHRRVAGLVGTGSFTVPSPTGAPGFSPSVMSSDDDT